MQQSPSVLQTLDQYAGFVYEAEPLESDNRIFRVPGGVENLQALQAIFRVNERAHFEFAVSSNSLREASARHSPRYAQWAHDVMSFWQDCLWSYDGSPFRRDSARLAELLEQPRFGYLGAGDRALIQDAVALDCDAFLTMERRLPRNARHIHRELGMLVLTPQ